MVINEDIRMFLSRAYGLISSPSKIYVLLNCMYALEILSDIIFRTFWKVDC